MKNNKIKNFFKFKKMSNNNILKKEINNEEEIIVNLMSEIFQYENKIKEINNILMNNNTDINKNNQELTKLKERKIICQEKISDATRKIEERNKIKDEQIKSKESMKNEIENKIQEYKYKINTFNVLHFNSIMSQNFLKNNNRNNDILTNEQINEILLKLKNNNENITDNKSKSNEDFIYNNKQKENDIINNINEINLKINQIDERIKMLREEKLTINNELINIISCKESIDAFIKFNHYLIKNYQENKDNKMDKNIKEKIDEEIYKKNKWNSTINLHFYELSIIDFEKLSDNFNEIIFDLYNLNKLKMNNSFAEIIKKEINSSIKNIQSGKCLFNKNIFLKSISYKIVNNLISHLQLDKKNNNINDINQNIIIYLSYYIKSLYYEKIINENFKFINKEYKYNKKELQKIISELNNEKKKQEIIKMDIHEKVINDEKNENIINNVLIKSKLLDNFNEKSNKLSQEENDYLQTCYKINNLEIQKNEIISDSEKIINEFKNIINELNNEKNKLNKELEEIDKKISNLSTNIEERTIKANNEIIEYRKVIAEKYNNIKEHLKKCKIKYGENTEEYNSLLTSINDTIKQKSNDICDINEIRIKQLAYSQDNAYKLKERNENLLKNSFYSSFNYKTKPKIGKYSSNKITKHINYYNKYFSHNLNEEKEKNKRKPNLKSFSQIQFYKGSYNPSLDNNIKNKNNNSNKDISNEIKNNNIIQSQNVTSMIDKYAKNLLNAFSHNKSNYNSFNFSRSINYYKNRDANKTYNQKNKENIYNIQSYNTINHKMSLTKQFLPNDLKEISQKLDPLFNITFCYLRKIESKLYHKYDPIQLLINSIIRKINSDLLTKYPYNFTKATISLNKSYKTLRIVLTSQLDPIDISIKDIKYTTIRTRTKIISGIYRDYKKFAKNGNECFQKDFFIKKEMEKYNNLSYDYISKCLENNKFNVMLYLENGKMIELVFCSYEEFKTWVNGFAFIVKTKDKLLKIHGEK